MTYSKKSEEITYEFCGNQPKTLTTPAFYKLYKIEGCSGKSLKQTLKSGVIGNYFSLYISVSCARLREFFYRKW